MTCPWPGEPCETTPPRTNSARPTIYRDRRESEESIPTELCDGPLPEGHSPPHKPSAAGDGYGGKVYLDRDRDALIQRIKRQQKAVWNVPSEQPVDSGGDGMTNADDHAENVFSSNQVNVSQSVTESAPDNFTAGLEIQRPRSALHAGDFSQNEETLLKGALAKRQTSTLPLSTSPPRPLTFTSRPPRDIPPSSLRLALSNVAQYSSLHSLGPHYLRQNRDPPSLSTSSTYVLKPPTSPLVQEESHVGQDFGDSTNTLARTIKSRRHTLTPVGGYSQNNDYSRFTAAARAPASFRREGTYPQQSNGHKSRLSLGASWTYQTSVSPSTPPSLRSRAPSFYSDASPRQSSMVGSYEESILRGRMSGTPSHPLTFEAGIGALGKPGFKPTMPAHVRIDFPAVFYSWTPGHGRVGSVNQEPSPYVGRIDLENNLPPPINRRDRRRKKTAGSGARHGGTDRAHASEHTKKRKHRDVDLLETPSGDILDETALGGAYRIPKKGSLQLIIKNPNKTAVKVFIVPYDLEGMLPRQRTWIRQRLYSAGPVVEAPISSKTSSTLERSEGDSCGTLNEKATLRYLVHFKICCTDNDRFYLYDEIRIVFANRVPDNKEKLRSEIMMPEGPRYMPFKTSLPSPSLSTAWPYSSPGNTPSEERAVRRRSHGLPSSPVGLPTTAKTSSRSVGASGTGLYRPKTPPNLMPAMSSRVPHGTDDTESMDPDTDAYSSSYIMSPERENWRKDLDGMLSSPESWSANDKYPGDETRTRLCREDIDQNQDHRAAERQGPATFVKLTRDDARFGGYFGRSSTPEPGEGLIARRLKSLEMDSEDKERSLQPF